MQTNPGLAPLRGAGVDVLLDAKCRNGLWLSEVADLRRAGPGPDVAAGLGVRYTCNVAWSKDGSPQTSPSPWQVTQFFPCLELTIR